MEARSASEWMDSTRRWEIHSLTLRACIRTEWNGSPKRQRVDGFDPPMGNSLAGASSLYSDRVEWKPEAPASEWFRRPHADSLAGASGLLRRVFTARPSSHFHEVGRPKLGHDDLSLKTWGRPSTNFFVRRIEKERLPLIYDGMRSSFGVTFEGEESLRRGYEDKSAWAGSDARGTHAHEPPTSRNTSICWPTYTRAGGLSGRM
ncbi:hypothetical protein BSF38_04381 [Paludisphaera borealis]|uniref:Uncharacterized protein n=1 Tax=Paludisphaera borealis TaxID=1387353 RepID=A0A1U7CV52_9BACT|nr:hypothetical protein BSF38_04381 [Paludisphaera borealis]